MLEVNNSKIKQTFQTEVQHKLDERNISLLQSINEKINIFQTYLMKLVKKNSCRNGQNDNFFQHDLFISYP